MGDAKIDALARQVLELIASKTGNAEVANQVVAAQISKRDYTRTGYFIYFTVPADVLPVEGFSSLTGPDIASADLVDGAGTTLFFRAGRLHYLEIYARGGFFPPDPGEFQLHEASQ